MVQPPPHFERASVAADDAALPDEPERREAAVPQSLHGQRLDKAVVAMATEFSRTHLQSLIEQGHVRVDGDVAGSASRRVRAGQMVCVELVPTAESRAFRPEAIALNLVFEDEHLLVVNKPGGLPTIPGGGYMENTLLRLVQRQFPNANPVHRLGRATSGLVLFAKTSVAARNLFKMWNTPAVEKIYRALSQGVSAAEKYEITTPIGLVPHPLIGSVWAASAQGKPSRSKAEVIARGLDSTIFSVSLSSGRPHQIRIHLASIGHPLVGDPLYGAAGLPLAHLPGLPGDGGYFLHARYLRLAHPLTGVNIAFEAALPVEWPG